MFQKVIISDDLGSVNHGVSSILKDLGVPEIIQVQYCDDAYLKIKKGGMEAKPFDLLITDLSFKMDHREQRFASGEALIHELRNGALPIAIIVYSVEDRPLKLRKLMQGLQVNGFVNKGRNGLKELRQCIDAVAQGHNFVSPHLEGLLRQNNQPEFGDYEALLLEALAQGYSQEEISSQFKQQKISPSSLSSIEKRLHQLREDFKANNVTHLVSIAKDLGLI